MASPRPRRGATTLRSAARPKSRPSSTVKQSASHSSRKPRVRSCGTAPIVFRYFETGLCIQASTPYKRYARVASEPGDARTRDLEEVDDQLHRREGKTDLYADTALPGVVRRDPRHPDESERDDARIERQSYPPPAVCENRRAIRRMRRALEVAVPPKRLPERNDGEQYGAEAEEPEQPGEPQRACEPRRRGRVGSRRSGHHREDQTPRSRCRAVQRWVAAKLASCAERVLRAECLRDRVRTRSSLRRPAWSRSCLPPEPLAEDARRTEEEKHYQYAESHDVLPFC